eukprot:scaffold47242_cov35-Tisochrysis_lutea.AAC.2
MEEDTRIRQRRGHVPNDINALANRAHTMYCGVGLKEKGGTLAMRVEPPTRTSSSTWSIFKAVRESTCIERSYGVNI